MSSDALPLISVIVPCYNYGWLLGETLDSVLAQTYPAWECIVVDDGSADDTRALAESYGARDARFRYVYQPNGGMSAARNHGLRLARGEYIQFLDADDLLQPGKLAAQAAFLDAHSSVDVVYGDVRYFRHGQRTHLSRSFDMDDTPWMRHFAGQGLEVVEQLVEHNEMVMNAPLLRAALPRRVGPFSESLRAMEDWEFWLRCAMQGATFYYQDFPNSWALVRVHPTSTSQNRPQMLDFTRQVREQLAAPLRRLGARRALAINQAALAEILERQALGCFKQGRRREGLRLFWRVAQATGRYGYYLRAAAYWLRQRPEAPAT